MRAIGGRLRGGQAIVLRSLTPCPSIRACDRFSSSLAIHSSAYVKAGVHFSLSFTRALPGRVWSSHVQFRGKLPNEPAFSRRHDVQRPATPIIHRDGGLHKRAACWASGPTERACWRCPTATLVEPVASTKAKANRQQVPRWCPRAIRLCVVAKSRLRNLPQVRSRPKSTQRME